MGLLIKLVPLAILVTSPVALADEDIKVSGHIDTQLKMVGFRNGESEIDAKLEVRTKRKQKTRATLDIRGRSDDNAGVVVRNAFLDYKFDSDAKLLAGLQRKRFGLEYERGRRNRHAIRRSPAYQKMEEFTYASHEMQIVYEMDAEDNDGLAYRFGFGYNESIDADITANVAHEKPDNLLNAAAWFQVIADHIDDRRQLVWASIFSIYTDQPDWTYQLELIGGQDPIESEFEKNFGEGENVYFTAIKAELSIFLDWFDSTRTAPIIQASILNHDHRTPMYRTEQILLGTNFYFTNDLKMAINLEYLANNSKQDLDRKNVDDSNGRIELTYFF